MSSSLKLTVSPREVFGRKVKSLRRQHIIPANLFGSGISSQAVQVSESIFQKIYEEAGETSVVDVQLEGESKSVPVLIHQLQHHPVTGNVIHVDFLQVDLKKKITTSIPVELSGVAPAVKDAGGVLVQALNEIEIEALPTDIPESLVVDVSTLTEIGQALTLKDISLPSQVTLLTDIESTLVTTQEPTPEEAEAEAPADVEEEGIQSEAGEADGSENSDAQSD
jgi:large subunit ribosomal protein L25